MRGVELHLDRPPDVAQAGVGVHGVRSPHDVFRLPDLWQVHLYDYAAEVSLLGETHSVRPGCVSLVPPGTEVRFDYRGRSEHLFAHFRTTSVGTPERVPVVQDAGAALPLLRALLGQAVDASADTPGQVAAAVWTMLWRVARLPSPRPGRHSALTSAVSHIEANLARPLAVPELARAAGVSHNQLTRLFRAETGRTVVGYVRARRLAMARHLLTSSTMSIPAVAATVGFDDLQAFNKACRRELGDSPRAIRLTAGRP